METNKKTNKKASPRGKKWKAGLILFVCVLIVLLVLVSCAGYGYYKSKINLLEYNEGTLQQEGTVTDEEAAADAAMMEQATADLEKIEAVAAEGDTIFDDDVFNVLLIGTDERTEEFNDNARGDSCMLLSINKKTMKVTLASFERGTGVPILAGQYAGQWDWLTHTFRYGGADLMMQEIRECYKLDVSHYIRVNFNTFAKVIDSVGGVDVTLSALEAQGLNGEVYTNATTHTRVSEGVNLLDGFDALQYSRLRYIDNDWHRIERQRNVMEQVIGKVTKLNILQLNELLDTVLPLVRTNLTESDITSLLLLAPNLGKIRVEQMTVPAEGTYGSMTGMGGRSLFAVNFDENAKLLHEALYEGALD